MAPPPLTNLDDGMLLMNLKPGRFTGALLTLFVVVLSTRPCLAEQRVIEPKMRHLRNAEPREWTEFPLVAKGTELVVPFEVDDSFQPQTLRVRHRDLKQQWRIYLDQKEIAKLPRDENSMVTFWPLPKEGLVIGRHEVRIATTDKTADDVEIGDLMLDTRPMDEWLGETDVRINVYEDGGPDEPFPCRLTIVDQQGSLVMTGARSDTQLAVRPGVIYTAKGRAEFTLPAGKYTLYAGRGFEYSLAQDELELEPGQISGSGLTIRHEVPTAGWVSCDTHVHTLSFSGHGDSTIEERMITLAGEGIELPIATDHNVQIDHAPYAAKLGLQKFFTPIVGNEVTTKVGHFNVFPLPASMPLVDHRGTDWQSVAKSIAAVGEEPVIVLNHARDIHSGFRPFDPARHITLAGEDREGWTLPANAMEIVNSGATLRDPWLLLHDWLALLNRGYQITPIGASDSHDVAKHFVGQARTYIRVADDDVGAIDTSAAIRSLREGRVMGGIGLACRALVNRSYEPGDLAPMANGYRVSVDVLGPSWTTVDEVRLYVNGVRWMDDPIESIDQPELGVRRRVQWSLPNLAHDANIVVAAIGPGVDGLYWPIAKPYQTTSPEWKSYVLGWSGAIRIDANGDGKFNSPREVATQVVEATAGDVTKLITELARYDEAVAVQAASVLRAQGGGKLERLLELATTATPQVRRGVLGYWEGVKAGSEVTGR